MGETLNIIQQECQPDIAPSSEKYLIALEQKAVLRNHWGGGGCQVLLNLEIDHRKDQRSG